MNEDEKMKKIMAELEFMNANSSIGEQSSPNTEYEGGETEGQRISGHNPQYIQTLQQKQAQAQPLPSEASQNAQKMSKIGSMAATAGAIPSPASPYLMGAGLGLQAIGMVQQGKQADRDAKYRAEVQKANARQAALDKLTQVGQSLKI